MQRAPFDPSNAVTFDLLAGQVRLDNTDASALVSIEDLCALCAAAGDDAARKFGQSIGQRIGKRVATRLQKALADTPPSLEDFAEQIVGQFALAGLGSLSFERWGKALIIVMTPSVMPSLFTQTALEEALHQATGRPVSLASLAKQEQQERFLVTNDAGRSRVVAWQSEGLSWGEVLVRLHGAHEASSTRGDA
jgi:hypothetical protein